MKPHEILGVAPDASEKEIKAAFKKLAKKYHPDVNGGDKDAEQKFKEVNAAYQKLTNPDPEPSPGFDGGFGGFGGFGGGGNPSFHPFFDQAIFDTMFRNGGAGASQVVQQVGVDPEMLINGGVFEYTTQQLERVNGRIRPVPKTHKVTVEPDTPALSRIALPSSGNNHFVFLELHPGTTARFKVDNAINLTETQVIDVFTAMSGGEIEVTAPNRKKINLKIPPGTQSGSIHRVRGLGLRLPDGRRGDYNVEVTVRIPTIIGKTKEEITEKIIASFMEHADA